MQLNNNTRQLEQTGITQQFTQLPLYQEAEHIAVYLATPNELNLHDIIQHCWRQQKKLYLPVIHQSQLHFYPYRPNTSLIKNQYNIFEPETNTPSLDSKQLDLVLMPLVAFDTHGHRLGMGKGFYDKTFHYLNQNPRPSTPFLLGISYECQQCSKLSINQFDITCNAILTYKKFYRCLT